MWRDFSADQPRIIWPPEPGFFELRLVRNGWPTPCRIICNNVGWQADINGCLFPPHTDPALAERVADIWHHGKRVAVEDWAWRHRMIIWAVAYQPDHPCLRPHRPMDPNTLTPIAPRRSLPC